MVDAPRDSQNSGMERYDASQGASQDADIIEGEFEEITEPEASNVESKLEAQLESPKAVASKPATKKPEEDIAEAEFEEITKPEVSTVEPEPKVQAKPEIKKPKENTAEVETETKLEDVAPPEQPEQEEDIAMKAHVKAEEERKKKQKLQAEQEAVAKKQPNSAQPQKPEQKSSGLTAAEQKFLKERVLGRENAVDGSESKIRLANGKSILETTVKIKGEERDFVGYKSRFRRMDEETAMAIVLVAKENGWDSIEVHGSKKSQGMLAKIAIEHGLVVDNYKVPEVKAPKQEAPKQEAPKQEAPKQEAPKLEAPKQEEPKQMVVSNLSGFTKAPVKVTSSFAQIGVDDKKPALPDPKDSQPKLSAPEKKSGLPAPEKLKALPPPPPKRGVASL